MKLIIEVDMEGESSDTDLASLLEYAAESAVGFMQAVGGSPNIKAAAERKVNWIEEKGVGVIFEASRTNDGPVSVRFGYAETMFDPDNWQRKYLKRESLQSAEYDPQNDQLIGVKNVVEAVEPSAVHDRQVQDH